MLNLLQGLKKWPGSFVIFAATTLASGPTLAHEAVLSKADVAAIQATLEEFRRAWLDNDATRVMAVLVDDAVIMPHHGVKPRVGAAAIKAFWWRPDSPPAKVVRFDHDHDEIGGSGDIAFVRGSSTIEYEWGDPGQERLYRDVGTSLTLLRRDSTGKWRISHRMWDDPPTENLGPVKP